MPRPKKITVDAVPSEPTPLGNLSPEDLKAIGGSTPDHVGFDPSPSYPMGDEPERSSAAFEQIAGRMLTLEGRMTELESAMEKWAAAMNVRLQSAPSSRFAQDIDAPIRAATPAEEAAYCQTNHDLRQRGDTPYDGIQAWRADGSPGLV